MTRRLLSVVVVVLLARAGAVGCQCGGEDPPPPPPSDDRLVLGPATPIGAATIGVAGGVVETDAGLQVEVPAGAFDGDVPFTITAQDVVSHDFGDLLHPVTPLYTVDNGGVLADDVLLVTIPVARVEGRFAMAFLWDADDERFEGLPLVEVGDTAVVVATRHFSSFLVTDIDVARLVAGADSGFTHGVDNFPFVNRGAFGAPDGHCAGQSLMMMEYFVHRRSRGAPPLFTMADNPTDPTTPTPDFDADDAPGWRAATAAQRRMEWGRLAARLDETFQDRTDPIVTFHAFAYALLLTGEPQDLGVYTAGGAGHAILVTAKEDNPTSPVTVTGPPAVWTCDLLHYDTDDGCQCGCGIIDPDCTDATLDACDSCAASGSCATNAATCDGVNPEHHAICGPLVTPTPATALAPGVLRVSDPNWPGADQERRVVFDFDTGRFLTYTSQPNASAPDEDFVKFRYFGQGAVIDRAALSDELDAIFDGSAGFGHFPGYRLEGRDATGGLHSIADEPTTTTTSTLSVTVEDRVPDFAAALTVFTPDLRVRGSSDDSTPPVIIDLHEGENRYGFLVEGDTPTGRRRIDFQWVTVVRPPVTTVFGTTRLNVRWGPLPQVRAEEGVDCLGFDVGPRNAVYFFTTDAGAWVDTTYAGSWDRTLPPGSFGGHRHEQGTITATVDADGTRLLALTVDSVLTGFADDGSTSTNTVSMQWTAPPLPSTPPVLGSFDFSLTGGTPTFTLTDEFTLSESDCRLFVESNAWSPDTIILAGFSP